MGALDAALVDHERLACVALTSILRFLSRGLIPSLASPTDKLLVCHRVFLGRSFRDAKYAYSRKAAIEAARSIIQELVKGSRLGHQHLWTVSTVCSPAVRHPQAGTDLSAIASPGRSPTTPSQPPSPSSSTSSRAPPPTLTSSTSAARSKPRSTSCGSSLRKGTARSQRAGFSSSRRSSPRRHGIAARPTRAASARRAR